MPCYQPQVELSHKKVDDGHPLRLWKATVELLAPPVEVLNRVLRERHLWDDDMIEGPCVEALDSQTEIFSYQLSTMAPHPTRHFCELRYSGCHRNRRNKIQMEQQS